MTKASDNPFPSLLVQEAATDGSDFSNPAADYRRLFLGEDGSLHLKDSSGSVTDVAAASGSVATDTIWDAAGDLVQGTGANTAAKLTLGAAGTVVRSTGSANAYAYPPGYEFDYAEVTSDVAISGTSEGSETTVVTGNAVTYDGSTAIIIEYHSVRVDVTPSAAGRAFVGNLYDGASLVGRIAMFSPTYVNGVNSFIPITGKVRLTPSNASHTYSIKAYKSNASDGVTVKAGSGGAGDELPTYIRITKV